MTAPAPADATRVVFVTGGVCSSLGKGILAASLGRLLVDRGLRVANAKLDPYLNVDPGTMAPGEHGEVFVTVDGGETDLDLGHYERFTGVAATAARSVTSGKLYTRLLDAERAGRFLGATVQAVPHVTNEIIAAVDRAALDADGVPVDVLIVEVGGTVGDIEIQVFLEAIRQLRDVRAGRVACVHLTLVPEVGPNREPKTKPSQHAVTTLRSYGVSPDVLVARSSAPLDEHTISKLQMTCGVRRVIGAPDASSIYSIPARLGALGLDVDVLAALGLDAGPRDSAAWEAAVADLVAARDQRVRIGVVAKYTAGHDTYLSVVEALRHAAATHHVGVELVWVDAEQVEIEGVGVLEGLDGIVVPGGFGSRGVEGKVAAAGFARTRGVPYLGLCLGLQVACVDAARAAGVPDAVSLEWSEVGSDVVTLMDAQRHVDRFGGTMRLGAQDAVLAAGSQVAAAYGCPDGGTVVERHRHRFEVNPAFVPAIESAGLFVVGRSPDSALVEFVERRDHRCFVATQAHPEFGSRPGVPHPLFSMFVAAAAFS